MVHATGGFTPESPIGSALESKRSGATFQLSEHGDRTMSFESILSFLGKNGSYCRQFLLKRTNSSGSNAVACRQPDGNWKLEILVAAKVNKAGGRIRTASALTSPEVDLVLDRLMGEIALDASDEIELIERGWRPQ